MIIMMMILMMKSLKMMMMMKKKMMTKTTVVHMIPKDKRTRIKPKDSVSLEGKSTLKDCY